MKIINIDIIKKYVNGEDLGNYSIEELENDKEFMKCVINYTNDYKIYSLCSDELKKDYEFVKFVIFKFRNNIEFINKVANYYLDNSNDNLSIKELRIIMIDLIPKNMYNEYRVMSESTYLAKRVEIEIEKQKDPNVEPIIDMGFIVLYNLYSNSEIILNYYAKLMLKEIIEENNINLERMIHNQIKNKDELNKIGLNNYLINFIENYDVNLSSYICTHLDIINETKEEINKIQDEWDTYESRDKTIRYNKMFEEVHEYLVEQGSNLQEEILEYVAEELGIEDDLKKYNGIDESDLDLEYDKEVMKDEIEFEMEKNPREKFIYSGIKKIVINQLFSDTPLELSQLFEEGSKNNSKKCNIIKLKPDNDK